MEHANITNGASVTEVIPSQPVVDLTNPTDKTDNRLTTKETQNLIVRDKLPHPTGMKQNGRTTANRSAPTSSASSASRLVRCASLMRLRSISSNPTDTVSSKLKRLNIFCTIRARRTPRAVRRISTTFRAQLNALRPTSGADEAAARDCLLELDDYLDNISNTSVRQEEHRLAGGIDNYVDIAADDTLTSSSGQPSRSTVRRHSFRAAMANAVATGSRDHSKRHTDPHPTLTADRVSYDRPVESPTPRETLHQECHHRHLASSDTDVSRDSCSEATAPASGSICIDESMISSASDASSSESETNHRLSINSSDYRNGITQLRRAIPTLGTRPTTSTSNNANTTDEADTRPSGPPPTPQPVPKRKWPLHDSRVVAATCCTLGLFNVSRFAIFSIHYGGNFIIQFLILSLVFGVPMLWLQMCLGAHIKHGPLSIWRISPICKGVGIALLFVQSVVAIYSTISISWVLVYLRDSVASKEDSRYRWERSLDVVSPPEATRLAEATADYFNYVVLQRWGLADSVNIAARLGVIRFQLAFNVAVLWAIIFCVSCEYLKANGKAIMILMTMQFVGLVALCIKVLSVLLTFSTGLKDLFPTTDWSGFMLNTQCWFSAAQEVFLTWALLGCSIISIFSKAKYTKATNLRRDALLVALLTIFGLILAGTFGNACVRILNMKGYFYVPGSFETRDSNRFLVSIDEPLPPQLVSTPQIWIVRYSSVAGEGYRRMYGQPTEDSGYQAIRLVTELFPATLAAATTQTMSSFWSVLGFLVFIMLGITQLFAMWIPITQILGSSISAILLSCVTGVILAIPLATQSGIHIMYFLDIVLGGSWCVMLLWIVHVLAIFLFRGRPYTADVLVKDLKLPKTASDVVALSWSLLLPFGMLTMCTVQYRRSNSAELFHWQDVAYYYWSPWTRKLGGMIQIVVLLLVPATAIVQVFRYLGEGPTDILDRVELLLRPSPHANRQQDAHRPERSESARTERPPSAIISLGSPRIDSPPKYTPPPSYTTATGARIVKMLRNTIRRSVRRLRGDRPNFDKNTGNDIQISTIHLTDVASSSTFVDNIPSTSSVRTITGDPVRGSATQIDDNRTAGPSTSATAPKTFSRSYSLPTNEMKRRGTMTEDRQIRRAATPELARAIGLKRWNSFDNLNHPAIGNPNNNNSTGEGNSSSGRPNPDDGVRESVLI